MTIRFGEGDDGWIIASVLEVPGTHSQGRTREEARTDVIDALKTMLTGDRAADGTDTEALVLTINR